MNDNLTDMTVVLDRSGSMAAVRDDTIGGFNSVVEEQKQVPGAADLTLVQFDDQYEVVYAGRRLRDVPALTTRTFVPRGSTALLDAVGRTIHATGARLAALPEADRPGKVLLLIMTDGEENSSHEFSRAQIFDMITHQQEAYAWEIVFVGTNQDAVATGASYGIPASNALNYAPTAAGTRQALSTFSRAASRMRLRSNVEKENFFSEEDKQHN